MHFREAEETHLEVNPFWHALHVRVDGGFEDHEFKRDLTRAKLIRRLYFEINIVLLTVLTANLRTWVPKQIAVAHFHQFNLVILRQVDHFKEVHDTVFEMGHLESHEVVKSARLHHFLHLGRKFEDFGVLFVHSHVVE